MKTPARFFLVCCAVAVGYAAAASMPSDSTMVGTTEAAPSSLKGNMGMLYVGFLSGTDYENVVKGYYTSKGYSFSGSTLFLGFGGRYEFRIVSGLYLAPGMTLVVNPIKKTKTYAAMNNYSETSDLGTVLFMPEFGATYYVEVSENLFSANVQFGYPMLMAPEDDLDFSGDGPSIVVSGGYRRELSNSTSLGVEIGYAYVPVAVKQDVNTNYYYGATVTLPGTGNFGGFFLKLTWGISFGG
jgi:hypothetical protein